VVLPAPFAPNKPNISPRLTEDILTSGTPAEIKQQVRSVDLPEPTMEDAFIQLKLRASGDIFSSTMPTGTCLASRDTP
jgi:hypothetical protein